MLKFKATWHWYPVGQPESRKEAGGLQLRLLKMSLIDTESTDLWWVAHASLMRFYLEQDDMNR